MYVCMSVYIWVQGYNRSVTSCHSSTLKTAMNIVGHRRLRFTRVRSMKLFFAAAFGLFYLTEVNVSQFIWGVFLCCRFSFFRHFYGGLCALMFFCAVYRCQMSLETKTKKFGSFRKYPNTNTHTQTKTIENNGKQVFPFHILYAKKTRTGDHNLNMK